MTAVDIEQRDTTAASRADLRPSTRWLAAILLPIGPAAVAVLRYVLPYFSAEDADAAVAAVLANPGKQSLVLWLGFIAILTLVPSVMWAGRLTRRRAPRVTAAAMLLLVPGYLSLGWLVAIDILLWTGARQDMDSATVAAMYDTAHPTTNIALVIFILGHVLGTVLLGAALWRSCAVPRWAAGMTVMSQPLHFAAVIMLVSPSLDLITWGMNAVGFAAVAVAILRLPDDEWDLPPK